MPLYIHEVGPWRGNLTRCSKCGKMVDEPYAYPRGAIDARSPRDKTLYRHYICKKCTVERIQALTYA